VSEWEIESAHSPLPSNPFPLHHHYPTTRAGEGKGEDSRSKPHAYLPPASTTKQGAADDTWWMRRPRAQSLGEKGTGAGREEEKQDDESLVARLKQHKEARAAAAAAAAATAAATAIPSSEQVRCPFIHSRSMLIHGNRFPQSDRVRGRARARRANDEPEDFLGGSRHCFPKYTPRPIHH
jgi:hypothetical protein